LIKETALIGTFKNKTKSSQELKTIKCFPEPYEEVIKKYKCNCHLRRFGRSGIMPSGSRGGS